MRVSKLVKEKTTISREVFLKRKLTFDFLKRKLTFGFNFLVYARYSIRLLMKYERVEKRISMNRRKVFLGP